jgi:hypothetical protein
MLRKIFNGQVVFGALLVLLSAALYWLHYLLFHDAHHIFIYLVGDIAFIPIEVLIVTVILHQILSVRERRAKLEKLNMIIGAFFVEMGTDLLTFISNHDPELASIRRELLVKGDWTDRQFREMDRRLRQRPYRVIIQKMDLAQMKAMLVPKREFMLRLLENQNLLEHEDFTNLMWATFHLTEELMRRRQLSDLPASDYAHLALDVERMYGALVVRWLEYMKHLKENYPYLFSLAMRTNPFDESASPVVKA